MTLDRIAGLALSLLVSAVPLAAQVAGACVGPGAAIGVIAYQCASCGIKLENGRIIYSFNAEPVITQVSASSVLRAGDVIEAVGGKPITTSDGADAFTSPGLGAAGRASGSVGQDDIDNIEILKGPAAAAQYGAAAASGVITIVTKRGKSGPPPPPDSAARLAASILSMLSQQPGARGQRVVGDTLVVAQRPLFIIDGVVQEWPAREIAVRVRRDGKSTSLSAPVMDRCDDTVRPGLDARVGYAKPTAPARSALTNRLGLAVVCDSMCSPAQTADGADYYRFGRYPSVRLLVSGGPAESAGLKVGDVIREVAGVSILTEEGALRFAATNQKESIILTVQRDGRTIKYLLNLPHPDWSQRPPD
ncbi:MAG: PDZ domain-containing protein [Gemmatimonadales bacterium]